MLLSVKSMFCGALTEGSEKAHAYMRGGCSWSKYQPILERIFLCFK